MYVIRHGPVKNGPVWEQSPQGTGGGGGGKQPYLSPIPAPFGTYCIFQMGVIGTEMERAVQISRLVAKDAYSID